MGRFVVVDDKTLKETQDRIGHCFADLTLLSAALTHASVAESRAKSNERLEFLGDAVLALIVCEHLYCVYPDLLEGAMTKIKSAVVSRTTCAEVACDMGLDVRLRIGKGMKTSDSLPSSVPAAALEAILGAVYLDGGLAAVKRIIMPHLEPIVERVGRSGHQLNFKSSLQQYAQQTLGESPLYIALDEQGPDHAKAFEVCVQIAGERYESAWGRSKKQAEQKAALLALRTLGVMHTVNGEEIVSSGDSDDWTNTATDADDTAVVSND